jgi:hypothetical protein
MLAGMAAGGELDPEASVASIALGVLGWPEEIAAAVPWLCSGAATYVTGVRASGRRWLHRLGNGLPRSRTAVRTWRGNRGLRPGDRAATINGN